MIQIAGVLLKKNDTFLLVQEKKQSVYGLWNLPAGHLDYGETLQEAAEREAEEETGFKVQVGKEILRVKGTTDDIEIHIFEAEIVGGEMTRNAEELLDIGWFTAKQIKKMSLGTDSFSALFET
jgi:8-oxo-dGTP diphosphatase